MRQRRRQTLSNINLTTRIRYEEALQIDKIIGGRKAALDRAHELRKFEIENYWKRATYFWAFQLAAFALLGLLWGKIFDSSPSLIRNALLVPAGLGAVTAQVGWLTARGSKFWQENWEAHVDMLEGEHEGRLTQVIFAKSGTKSSVTRINERLFFFLMLSWVAFFILTVFPVIEAKLLSLNPIISIIGLLSAMLFISWGSATRLTGWTWQSPQTEWQPSELVTFFGWCKSLWNRYVLISPSKVQVFLRDTASGRAKAPSLPTDA